MENEKAQERLHNYVLSEIEEPPEYFMYDNYYEDEDGNEQCGSVLSVEFVTYVDQNLNVRYVGAIICTCTGGPHVELDTKRGVVRGISLGAKDVEISYPHCEQVDTYWEEMYRIAIQNSR